MLRITSTLEGVDEAVEALADSLNDAVFRAMAEVGEEVAREARDQHPYQNRTGDLERSTQGQQPVGRFMDGSLYVEVTADMPYGQFVAAKMPFLEPALERAGHAVEALVEDALTVASPRLGARR